MDKAQPSQLPSFPASILPIILIVTVTAWLLARAHALQPADLRQAVDALNAQTTTSDAVITGTPDESVAFSDLYKGHADVLGLSAGSRFDEDTAAVLAKTAQKHERVWWLPNWLPPGDIRIERWLMERGFRVGDRSFGEQRLALFYFPAQPLEESAIGATFGEAIVLERSEKMTVVQPGDILPVALQWQAIQRIPADYFVFVHLVDQDGNRVAQSDGQPATWTRPTSSWTPGEPIEDRHALLLSADLAPGDYTLIAGLYLAGSDERLLTESGQPSAFLGTINVQE